MVRDVGDIIFFKPSEYFSFAAKTGGLVRRRRRVAQSDLEIAWWS